MSGEDVSYARACWKDTARFGFWAEGRVRGYHGAAFRGGRADWTRRPRARERVFPAAAPTSRARGGLGTQANPTREPAAGIRHQLPGTLLPPCPCTPLIVAVEVARDSRGRNV